MLLQFHGIEIDLLYAQLHMNMVDNNIDLLASSTIRNCHPASVRSLNGCRVTDTILREVRDSQKEDFKLVSSRACLWGGPASGWPSQWVLLKLHGRMRLGFAAAGELGLW